MRAARVEIGARGHMPRDMTGPSLFRVYGDGWVKPTISFLNINLDVLKTMLKDKESFGRFVGFKHLRHRYVVPQTFYHKKNENQLILNSTNHTQTHLR